MQSQCHLINYTLNHNTTSFSEDKGEINVDANPIPHINKTPFDVSYYTSHNLNPCAKVFSPKSMIHMENGFVGTIIYYR